MQKQNVNCISILIGQIVQIRKLFQIEIQRWRFITDSSLCEQNDNFCNEL